MNQQVGMNRLHNTTNRMQGDDKRVLCCCTAGLLRSPTAAMVLGSEPFNYNTRAVGLENHYALIPIDPALAVWAHEFVVMEEDHRDILVEYLTDLEKKEPLVGELTTKPIIVLNVPDRYMRMDERLQEIIKQQYTLELQELEKEKNEIRPGV